MNLTILALFVLVAFIIIVKMAERSGAIHRKGGTQREAQTFLYKKRFSVMNRSEASFFQIIRSALPSEYYIFPKMRIADIIETRNGKGYYKQRNKILPKHVDFIVCGKNIEPLVAIEIDGKSHNSERRIQRDREVDEIFKGVNVPLVHVHVGDNFAASIEEVKALLGAVNTPQV